MLLSLTVKNFAIIDNISIDFNKGMTVLTGETGAGKSLIIDAIGLLFGDRASNELVRYGENKAIIEGVFSDYSNNVCEILENNDITNSDLLVIKREIYQNGKSIAKINGETITLNVLELLSTELGDIHTQFDVVKLVNPKNYFSFIDNDRINFLLNDYKDLLNKYRKVLSIYNQKKEQEGLNNQKLDFLNYQKNELEKAKLDPDEEEILKNELNVINNFEKISENYQEFIDLFADNNIIESIYDSINALKKNVEYNGKLENYIQRLESAYYDLDDLNQDIISLKKDIEYNPLELDQKNERLSVYSSLKRKYKMDTKQLIAYYNNIKKEIDDIENYDFQINELEKQKNQLYQEVKKVAEEISSIRFEEAKVLKDNLLKVFPELSLKNTNLDIILKQTENFYNNGIDEIDFMISFNKGEPLKPLNKTASGGELSRFMLALKAISCHKNMHKTFIFDEIDTGVSGEVAGSIALKMKEISQNNQVICVTHLPQVASIASEHLNITKNILENNRTITNIKKLNYDEKVNSIALMISKGNITDASIALAKEFLNN